MFETETLLQIFQRRKWIRDVDFADRREDTIRLARRISALINAIQAKHEG